MMLLEGLVFFSSTQHPYKSNSEIDDSWAWLLITVRIKIILRNKDFFILVKASKITPQSDMLFVA
ncbi:hypothetical protein MARI151_20137 [Maribacter litoralis]|uniref:Uncharacterized protein n=1 Tax=Maribacter litoralis TaxID=2059726 RepID=A0A653P762_9FLAO|nr:hypothetical protein MARI151_20137 [Maribacter litoralis]